MTAKHLVAIIGPRKAGKSQVFNLLSGKRAFENDYTERPGSQVQAKTYPQDLEIKYMDFGSNMEASQISLTKASKILLVVDISEADWQSKLTEYLTSSGIVIPRSASMIIVGTQTDKLDGSTFAQRQKALQAYAQENRAEFQLISTKDGTNLYELSKQILSKWPDITPVPPPSTKAVLQRRQSLSQVLDAAVKDSAFLDADELLGRIVGTDSPVDERLLDQVSPLIRRASDPNKQLSSRTDRSLKNELDRSLQYTPLRNRLRHTPDQDNYLAFSLRLAGLAIMLTALTNLIYLAIVATGFLSSTAVLAVVNQVVVTVGTLLGMSAPMAAFSNLCATLGMSTSVGAGVFAATANMAAFGIGYGLRSLGFPTTPRTEETASASSAVFSYALRLIGMLLIGAALINLIYLTLIAAHVLSAAALTAGMNQILVTVGGLLSMSAPVTAYANACAAVGLTTTTTTSLLSATSSVILGGLGYRLFGKGRPVEDTDHRTPNNSSLMTPQS